MSFIQLPVGQVGKSLLTFGVDTTGKSSSKIFRLATNGAASSPTQFKVVVPGKENKNYGKLYVANFLKGKAVQLTEILTDAAKTGKGKITEFTTYVRDESGKLVKNITKKVDETFKAPEINLEEIRVADLPKGLGIKAGENVFAGVAPDFQTAQVGKQSVQVLQKGQYGLPSQTLEYNGQQLNWGKTY